MPFSCMSLVLSHHMCLTFAKSSMRFTAHMMNESAVLNSIRFSIQSHSSTVSSIIMCMNVVSSVCYFLCLCLFYTVCLVWGKRKDLLFIKACCTLFTVLGVSCLFAYVYNHISVQQHCSHE